MTVQGTFAIEGSFGITGRGLVIYGDIIDGIVKKENLLSFMVEGREVQLKIRDINSIDRISESISKVGLTFYYENDEHKKQLEALRVEEQTGKIISD